MSSLKERMLRFVICLALVIPGALVGPGAAVVGQPTPKSLLGSPTRFNRALLESNLSETVAVPENPVTSELVASIAQTSIKGFEPISGTIAFVSKRRNFRDLDIWLIDPVSGELFPITSDEAHDTQPRWSSDGRLLAFRSQWPDYHSTIWVLDVTTGQMIEMEATCEY
ncbi:MAG: hypothetical protein U9R25_00735 [Chloroflexota bacterium]|nr:hypothetical protein [Chloroflexota bacterium]